MLATTGGPELLNTEDIDCKVIIVDSVRNLRLEIANPNTQAIIFDFDNFEGDIEESLSVSKTLNNMVPRIAIVPELNLEVMQKCVNQFEAYKVLTQDSIDDLPIFIKNAINQYRTNKLQKNLYSEVKYQNQLLEEFTLGLEKIVEERTHDFEKSKRAVEKHVALIRGLNRFTTELSSLSSIDEVLLLLRREFKKFHKMSAPVLAVDAKADTAKLFYFHGSNIHMHILVNQWPTIDTARKGSIEDQKFLANEMGRPLGSVLSIPINGENGNYVIYLENQLDEDELQEFFSFLGDRLSSLEMTLERLVLDQEIQTSNLMWESTFNSVSEPLAVISEDLEIVRSNNFFTKGKLKCYEALGQTKVCIGCPIENRNPAEITSPTKVFVGEKKYLAYVFPMTDMEEQKDTFVNYYVDITKSENLQGQIIQNEKMAAVGNLADHIAHELHNPLTGIRSLSQVLINETKDKKQLNSDLIEVEKASGRCQNIINNLLDFSKGQEHSSSIKIDLSEIVDKTLPFLKSVMGRYERDIELQAGIHIHVDPQLIQQVVFNLINNACQAMGDKSGALQISTSIVNSRAVFKVKDSGPGISDELISKVFEPFYTTKSQGEGTGLGLSVCKNIIESYGGTIGVDTQLGLGAEFYFTIPIHQG